MTINSNNKLFSQHVLDNSLDIIIAVDLERRILIFNKSAQKVFGYSFDEVSGKNISLLYKKIEEKKSIFEKLNEKGEYTGEVLNVKKNQEVFLSYLSASIIFNENNEKIGYMGISRDITESKKIDERINRISQINEAILENINVWFSVLDKNQNVLIWNSAAEKISGYTLNELNPGLFPQLFPDEQEREKAMNLWLGLTKGKNIENETLLIKTKNGESKYISYFAKKFMDLKNDFAGIVIIGLDVSDSKKLEMDKKMAAILFEHSEEAMLIGNNKGIIEKINPAFSKMTGYNEEEAIGKPVSILRPVEDDNDTKSNEIWSNLHEKGYWTGEHWGRRKTGEIYPIWLSITAVINEDKEFNNIVAIANDITGRKAYDELLKYKAYHDALTGIPNRDLFFNRFQLAIDQDERLRKPVVIFFLDLDGFKPVNDKYGHHIGDKLLKMVVERIKRIIRKGDTLARMGGDEFVILMPDLKDRSNIKNIAEKVLDIFKNPFIIDDKEINVGTSIGISIFPDHGEDCDILLEKADKAMYHVKETGKNNYSIAQ